MIKRLFPLILSALAITACSDSDDEPADDGNTGNQPSTGTHKWHLQWEENFESATLDESVWSRTDRGTPDWQNTQSKDDRCYEMRNGNIVLKGIVNDDLTADPSPYLTGGIWTKGKKPFGPGCIQVRARLGKGAAGAWPAIWMMPFAEDEGWPECGEIDIMERLNHDDMIYQTLHSNYINTLGNKTPQNSITTDINPDRFNIYEVQIWETEVKFYVNNQLRLSYPKINGGASGQFPFYKEWYLIIDMQLGGSWVGAVDPAQLPVEMEVDWVRYYTYY